MYVTRRLLKSTLPAEGDNGPKPEETFSPPPRRPLLRTTEMVHESTTKSPSHKKTAKMKQENHIKEKVGASKRSAKRRKTNANGAAVENGGSSPETTAIQRENQQQHTKKDEKLPGLGLLVDVRDSKNRWCEAKIKKVDPDQKRVYVHYVGWNPRYDSWMPLKSLSAHGTHTGAPWKRELSWNGKTSLFETPRSEKKTAKVGYSNMKSAVKKDKMQRSRSPMQRARRNLRQVKSESSCDASSSSSESEDKPSPKSVYFCFHDDAKVKDAKEPEEDLYSGSESISNNSNENENKIAEKKANERQIQVDVDAVDEASERKMRHERKDPVDMELNMDVNGHSSETSIATEYSESDDEYSDNDDPPLISTRRNTRSRDTNVSTLPKKGVKRERDVSPIHIENNPSPTRHNMPQASPGTKERLAAIFRLRLQQKQQLEHLQNHSSSLQDQVRQAAAPVAITSESDYYHQLNAFHLQQYYYRQALLASTNAASEKNADSLQGGVLDSRVIQARLDELEQQRQLQQQHVQEYYDQVLRVRERNMQLLASSQEFLEKSGHMWQEQTQQLQTAEKPPEAEADVKTGFSDVSSSEEKNGEGEHNTISESETKEPQPDQHDKEKKVVTIRPVAALNAEDTAAVNNKNVVAAPPASSNGDNVSANLTPENESVNTTQKESTTSEQLQKKEETPSSNSKERQENEEVLYEFVL